MKFEIGDLVYMNKNTGLDRPECGTIIEKKGGWYYVAFPTGMVSLIHPRWLIKGVNNEKTKTNQV